MRILLQTAFLLFSISTACQSQTAPVRYMCTFEQYASPQGGLKRVEKLFEFELVVDSITNDAVLIGTVGVSSAIDTVDGRDAITFLEPLPTGVVQSTTIIKATGGSRAQQTHLYVVDFKAYPVPVLRILQNIEMSPTACTGEAWGLTHISPYFIASGEIEVELHAEPLILGQGHFFGEVGLLHSTVRNATVIALTECRLLMLDTEDFKTVLERFPEVRNTISKVA